ncbi:MAG: DUF87 domain-containing protein [Clostridia bacterium]|jgi:hypothetical protein
MKDFEKLGVFYLGKKYDIENRKLKDDYVLLKSKDLTTHAVIIGMTGSGKTGLGIGLIEEAMMDNIPVIAIDPKGDLTNLALTFPLLKGDDFRPWINLQEASNKGMEPEQYAQAQADSWKKGLSEWGQDGLRIQTLKNESDVKIYTPGGSSGIGVSVLKSFNAPSKEVLADKDTYRDRISATTTGLLSLLGINADSFTSREFILISKIMDNSWAEGKSITLPQLIAEIQNPPFAKIGVMDINSIYPSKDRFNLAMLLNNLIAHPGFEAWMEGEPLDIDRFFYGDSGKPKVSVFSIAHLSDSERMFFVTMLLNEVLSWVRSQPGTGSLRAMIYMDELFGYLPPIANPPSKAPLLTLLKQARAYGLGLVLSTQNPVDLDYKALSNAGTWFIGRLQTERDKQRVVEGLEGAAAGGSFDKNRTEQILAGIGQRVFYLHSVHENEPIIFNTRWVMSYLAGPLTKDQISKLPFHNINSDSSTVYESSTQETQFTSQSEAIADPSFVLSPIIKQVFLPEKTRARGKLIYKPAAIGVADVMYSSEKYMITATKSYTIITQFNDGPVTLDWNQSQIVDISINDIESTPVPDALFADYPPAAANSKNYDLWKKSLTQYIRTNLSLKLYSSPKLKMVSKYGEEERDFIIRMQHYAHEKRDQDLETMKKKYSSKLQTLENALIRAKQAVEKQNAMASQRKMDAMVSAGSAILGALLGRKTVSATSVSKIGTAVSRTSKAMKSGQSIDQAEERLKSLETQIEDLQIELEQQLKDISYEYDLIKDNSETIEIRAASTNITVHLSGLAWVPFEKGDIKDTILI